MQHTFRILRDLRNSVHNEALNLTRADGAFYITTEPTTQGRLRDFLREGHTGWTSTTLGIKVQPPGGEPRAGRPIRYYRSVADAVFAPLELTSLSSVADLIRFGRRDSAQELDRALENAWLRLGSDQYWGRHIYRHPGGDVSRDFVPRRLLGQEQFWSAVLAADAPAVWDQDTVLHLTKETAEALQRRLSKIAGEYGDPATAGDKTMPYLCRLAIAPTETL